MVCESEFKSDDPGFDPLVGQGEGQFFYPSESTLVQACLCLTPPSCGQPAPTFMRTLKILYPSVVKEYRPHSQWYGHTKIMHIILRLVIIYGRVA